MDFTSWWPRPKAEGITEELAALQERSGVVPAAGATPVGVRAGGSFPRARRNGYDVGEVDAFLARVESLSAQEIRDAQFSTTRKGGYEMDDVDARLSALEAEARAAGR
jgi:DivIVA domain-containing protein